jgi:hypothetical protein
MLAPTGVCPSATLAINSGGRPHFMISRQETPEFAGKLGLAPAV